MQVGTLIGQESLVIFILAEGANSCHILEGLCYLRKKKASHNKIKFRSINVRKTWQCNDIP